MLIKFINRKIDFFDRNDTQYRSNVKGMSLPLTEASEKIVKKMNKMSVEDIDLYIEQLKFLQMRAVLTRETSRFIHPARKQAPVIVSGIYNCRPKLPLKRVLDSQETDQGINDFDADDDDEQDNGLSRKRKKSNSCAGFNSSGTLVPPTLRQVLL